MKKHFFILSFVGVVILSNCTYQEQATVATNQENDSVAVVEDTIPHPQRIGIRMTKDGGVYTIPCLVNGVKMNFIFDTGASNVCISLTEALFLYKNGYIDNEDLGGKTKSIVADGSITTNTKLTLKTIEIGGIVLRNVDALVSSNIEAPLLLGQSALQKLGKFEIDGDSLFFTGIVEHPQIHQYTQDETSMPIPPLTPKITIWDKIIAFFGNEKKVEDFCIKAWNAYQNDMPELAIEYCDRAIACRKRSWKPYAVQGKIILDMVKNKLNKDSQASSYFSKAVKLNKYKETFYLNENDSISYKYTLEKHCWCFAQWGGIEALKEAQSALVEFPDDASLISTISFYYTQGAKYELAEKWAKKLVEIEPYRGYFRLAYLAQKQGRLSEAIKYYEQILLMDNVPERAIASTMNNLSNIYWDLNQHQPYWDHTYQNKAIELKRQAAILGNIRCQEWLKENGYDW